ncbi:calcium-binding protein, partial [Metapseudomonas furukawaii]
GQQLTATRAFTDPDGPANPVLAFQWQAGSGTTFNNIAGATQANFTPTLAHIGQQLRVVVTYTDGLGTLETVTSAATSVVAGALMLGTAGNDVLNGTAGADEIQGGGGNDTLNGLAGDDVLIGGVGSDLLVGGAGIDTMLGGAGNDFYYVDNAADTVTELTGEGQDMVRTTLSSYTLGTNVEHLVYTGAGSFIGTGNGLANTMIGNGGNDTLSGGAGNDVLRGNAGSDLLVGGTGIDMMFGGAGNDFYYVDNAADGVTESSGEGQDMVRTTLSSYTLGANVEHLVYTGSGSFTGIGNALDNTIISGSGDDLLNGGAGNDVLRGNEGSNLLVGGAGIDMMFGGTGNDFYYVDNVADVVTDLAGEGLDLVRTTLSSYTLGAGIEHLAYIGAGSFTGNGNGSANTIFGGNGNDTLNGGAGNDVLVGGQGADTLTGGTGVDIFMFGAGFGNDRVMDFDANPAGGQDLLHIG